MKKFSLSLALCAAFSFAVVTAMPTPADASSHAGKSSKSSKSSKSKPAKVTVNKSASPVSITHFNHCVGAGSGWGFFAPVVAVGCGAVFAVPVIVESFLFRRA